VAGHAPNKVTVAPLRLGALRRARDPLENAMATIWIARSVQVIDGRPEERDA